MACPREVDVTSTTLIDPHTLLHEEGLHPSYIIQRLGMLPLRGCVAPGQ